MEITRNFLHWPPRHSHFLHGTEPGSLDLPVLPWLSLNTSSNGTIKPNNNNINNHKLNLSGKLPPQYLLKFPKISKQFPFFFCLSFHQTFYLFIYFIISLCNLICSFICYFFIFIVPTSEICKQWRVRFHSRWPFTTLLICRISLNIHPTFLHVCKFFTFSYPFVEIFGFLCFFPYYLATYVWQYLGKSELWRKLSQLGFLAGLAPLLVILG